MKINYLNALNRANFSLILAFVSLALSQNIIAGNLTLTWDPSTSSNVGGYVLAYGDASKNYTADIDVGKVNTYQISGLQEGASYYFAVKAYDSGHTTESVYSNEVKGTVPVVTTALVANFTANVVSGAAPLQVNFTDTSTGNITSRLWNFGDGTTSTAASPSHTFAEGTYTVSLTVSGAGGSKTKTNAAYIVAKSITPTPVPTPTPTPTTSTPPSKALVAAYNFEEVSGSVAVDASGNANHGTLTAGILRRDGRFGKGLLFNGINDYVTAKDSATLDVTNGFTLEAWVKPSAIKVANVLAKEQTGGTVYKLNAYKVADLPSTSFHNGVGYRATQGVNQLPINTWSHLAATYDRQYLRLYVNGVQVSAQNYTGPVKTSSGALRIGGNSIWGEYFKGIIDEVRVYNQGLTGAQIQSDFKTAIVATQPTQFIVGNNALEQSVDNNPQGLAEAFVVNAAKAGAITSLNVYLDQSSTATEIVAGIYSDNLGHPGKLLAQGKLASPKAGTTNTVMIPTAKIEAGKSYWLAILGSKGVVKFRDRMGSNVAMETSSSSALNSLPSNWTTGKVYADGPMSIFGKGN